MLPPPQNTDKRVYRTLLSFRLLIYLLAPALAWLFLALPLPPGHGTPPSVVFVAGFTALRLGMVGVAAYGLLEVTRRRISIDSLGVCQVAAFRTKRLALDEISGYRVGDNSTRICPKDARLATLKFGYSTQGYREISQWLAARYPDLDQVATAQTTTQLLADGALGTTPANRAEAIAEAQKIANLLNITGCVLGAWLLFYPHPYQLVVGANLLLPALTTAALWRWPHVLCVAAKTNGYPSLFAALFIPATALVLRTVYDYKLVAHAPLWPLVGATAATAALLLAVGSRQLLRGRGLGGQLVACIALLALLYGYGASFIVNAAHDEGPATTYAAPMLSKHINANEHTLTSYVLQVGAWGPVATNGEVRVSRAYYEQVHEGQLVTIALRPGRLGVPWFRVQE